MRHTQIGLRVTIAASTLVIMGVAARQVRFVAQLVRRQRLNAPLIAAARQHDTTRIKTLLDAGADANATDAPQLPEPTRLRDWPHYLYTLLHPHKSAAIYDPVLLVVMREYDDPTSIAMLLVQHGANVNARDEQGNSALIVAATLPVNEPLLSFLLDKGADVNAVDQQGAGALHDAVSDDNIQEVDTLLAHGAVINTPGRTAYNKSIFEVAVGSCSPRTVRLLLEHGADFRARTADGYSMLNVAAHSKYPEVLRMLLDLGLNVNDTVNGVRATPLMDAITAYTYTTENERVCSLKKIDMLLDSGADVNLRDKDGKTALHWAEEYRVPIMDRLRKMGAKE